MFGGVCFLRRILRELVGKLRIAEESQNLPWDKYLGAFDVIRLVMTDFIKENIFLDFLRDWMKNKSYIALSYSFHWVYCL